MYFGEVPVTGITLNVSDMRLEKGQKNTLAVTISPSQATDKKITWSSSNEDVATVDENGVITCKANSGSAYITATVGEYSVSCKVLAGESSAKSKNAAHWYAEWMPNGDDTHSASCKIKDCDHVGTVGCEVFEYVLMETVENELTEKPFVICPVCGEIKIGTEIEDEIVYEIGTRLELVEEAVAEGEDLPKGELVLRKNDAFMSVGFEYGGGLTQPTKEVTVILPAEIVNGYTLTLLAPDGTETALETTLDSEAETIQFTLDFGETPVVMIHMVAEA